VNVTEGTAVTMLLTAASRSYAADSACTYERCGTFSYCLFLLGCPYSLIAFQWKKALLWRFNVASDCKVYLDLHVKGPVFFSILIKFGTFPQIVIKVPSIMFDGNPSSGSRAVHADSDGHT